VRAASEGSKQGCRVIAITDNDLSPTGRLADIVLLTGYESMSFFNSNVGVMALLNALATSVALKHREASRERVRLFSDIAARWEVFYNDALTEEIGKASGGGEQFEARKQVAEYSRGGEESGKSWLKEEAR
jgi:fructoselysine-6-P-deglycase FrlB-like protein